MTFLKLLGAIHSADRNVAVEGVRHALMDGTDSIRIRWRNRRLGRALYPREYPCIGIRGGEYRDRYANTWHAHRSLRPCFR